MRSWIAATAGWFSLALVGLCTLAPQLSAQNLTIALTHAGTLQLGQTNAYYLLRVKNVGAAPTSTFVSVIEIAPAGLTITSMAGDGWTCTVSSCGRSDTLGAGASYPAIMAVASVAPTADPSLLNSALVVGGGGVNDDSNFAFDLTTVAGGGYPVAWGANESGEATVPPGLSNIVAVAGEGAASFALKSDGTVQGWGGYPSNEQPTGLTGVLAIAAGADSSHVLALKGDGTVVAWGANGYGQSTVPPGLSSVVAIAAGRDHSLALKSDGAVVAWGANGLGQSTVPPGLSGAVAIAAGFGHSLALKNDGTLMAWGDDAKGQTSVPEGLSSVAAITAGAQHTLARKSDGTVVAWGDNSMGQTTVPGGLSNVVAIAAGYAHSLALRRDGTLVAWGSNYYGETSTPPALSGIIAIAAGGVHSLVVLGAMPSIVAVNFAMSGSPSGLLAIDDATYSSLSMLLDWTQGSSHTIGTASPVSMGGTAQYVFTGWSDGGAISHTVTPTIATNYTANFKPQYLVTTAVSAPTEGGISPASGFFDSGDTVHITATPNPGYVFTGFSGGLTGEATPQNLTVLGALTVTANFTPVTGSAALRFIPLTPCRVVDTRLADGPFGGPSIIAGTSRDFAIPGSTCSIPAMAQAFSLNVTVVPPSSLGYLTIWPAGQAKPVASTLNSLDGRIKANAAIVPAGNGGAVSIFSSSTTQVVLDIDGYFVPATDPNALAFYPLTPCRVSDTRLPVGALGGPLLPAGTSRTVPILLSNCGVPASAQAYSLNITAVPTGSLGYVTTWPTGKPKPTVSTLNALTGAITANAAIVPAGAGGAIDLFASSETNLVVDINGYFAPPGAGGLSLYPLPPCRVMDSRKPAESPALSAGVPLEVDVMSSGCGAPLAAQAYVLNATVVPPTAGLGYLTLWPQGLTRATVSTLNALDAAITSNMALVPTTNGSISMYPSSQTHVVLDIAAYFAP